MSVVYRMNRELSETRRSFKQTLFLWQRAWVQ